MIRTLGKQEDWGVMIPQFSLNFIEEIVKHYYWPLRKYWLFACLNMHSNKSIFRDVLAKKCVWPSDTNAILALRFTYWYIWYYVIWAEETSHVIADSKIFTVKAKKNKVKCTYQSWNFFNSILHILINKIHKRLINNK